MEDQGEVEPLSVESGIADSARSGTPMVEVSNVAKAYGITRALRGVSLTLYPGEVHALLGENGAGKSTLVRVMVGGCQPDSGQLLLDGSPTVISTVRDATERGILPVYQQLSLMPHLSVLENLMAFELAQLSARSLVRFSRSRERAKSALAEVGLDVDPQLRLGNLSLAERQLVELARCGMRDGRVVLLDEPTASLAAHEVESLFAVIAKLRDAGRAVMFISHRLDEVEQVADRVSILRDGESVINSVPLSRLSREKLVSAMVGREVDKARVTHQVGEERILEARRIGTVGAFRDVDLAVHSGEIVGVVGLIGSGSTELGQALAGVRRIGSGELLLDGQPVKAGDRAAALRSGIGLISIDRDRDGIFPGHSILHNASVSNLWRLARRGWLSPAREREWFSGPLRDLDVKPNDPQVSIDNLSGGNRQKVMVARSLTSHCRLLIAQEPTRGVDIGARAGIHRTLIEAAEKGMGIVVTSSDLDEVTALCNRIFVMRSGRIVAELSSPPAEEIVQHLTGSR